MTSINWLKDAVRRIVCKASPQWMEIGRRPLTIHLYYKEVKVGEKQATVIEEMNRCGDTRLLVDEGDGDKYELPRHRFWSASQVS